MVTEIYTDGGIRGNGQEDSLGAYAFTLKNKDTYYEYSRVEVGGTNQTMELKALISALYYCTTHNVKGIIKVYSDSKYVIGCATKWLDGWRANDYQRKDGELKNRGLIIVLDKLIQSLQGDLIMEHVKGHNGNEGNEYVDSMCTEAMNNHEVVQ